MQRGEGGKRRRAQQGARARGGAMREVVGGVAAPGL